MLVQTVGVRKQGRPKRAPLRGNCRNGCRTYASTGMRANFGESHGGMACVVCGREVNHRKVSRRDLGRRRPGHRQRDSAQAALAFYAALAGRRSAASKEETYCACEEILRAVNRGMSARMGRVPWRALCPNRRPL